MRGVPRNGSWSRALPALFLAACGTIVEAHVAQAAVVPTPGHELPRGATVTGPCTPAAPFPILPADPPLGLPYHGDEVYTRIGFVDPGGSGPVWGYIRPGPDPGGGGVCPSGDDAEVTVSRPGPWRMEVVNHVWDLSWGGWGWVTDSDSERVMRSVDFRVAAKSCTGDQNAVKSVHTPSGSDLGLPGTQIFPGQVISASGEDVWVDLEDGTGIRLTKGSRVRLECAPGRPAASLRISLLVGKIWAKVAKRLGADAPWQVQTPFSGASARGTEFWVSYDPSRKLTRLEVVRGLVSFARRRAPNRAILVRGGRKAVQQGYGAPRFVVR